MRLALLAVVLAGIVGGGLGGLVVALLDRNTGAGEAPASRLGTLFEATQDVLPSVVIVETDHGAERDAQGRFLEHINVASGLVFSADGFIVTNDHVVRDPGRITVRTVGGTEYAATLVGSDWPFTDVAVLRVQAQGLIRVRFGSSGALRLGDTVAAQVGYPLNAKGASVTVGVVSDPDTTFPRDFGLQEFLIQTDAALNFGNSGVALVSLDGRVVRLTTTMIRETEGCGFVDGIGFALQSDVIRPIAEAIMLTGRYPRPWLGVVREQMLDTLREKALGLPGVEGTLLLEITRSGPLALAGLRPGNVLLRLGLHTITPDLPYLNALRRFPPGETITVALIAGGEDEQQTVTVTAEARE